MTFLHSIQVSEMSKKMQEVMSNPETRQQMQDLSQRMANASSKVQAKLKEMSAEDKKKYIDEVQTDPLLTKLNSCGQDIVKRLETFKMLSDEEVDRMLLLQHLIVEVAPHKAAEMMQGEIKVEIKFKCLVSERNLFIHLFNLTQY